MWHSYEPELGIKQDILDEFLLVCFWFLQEGPGLWAGEQLVLGLDCVASSRTFPVKFFHVNVDSPSLGSYV